MPESTAPFTIEFYEDAQGRKPVLRWIEKDLTPQQRRVLVAALDEILAHEGVGVCGMQFGRQLGRGLFEFRVSQPSLKILLRVFRHAHGDRLVLTSGDEGSDSCRPAHRRSVSFAPI